MPDEQSTASDSVADRPCPGCINDPPYCLAHIDTDSRRGLLHAWVHDEVPLSVVNVPVDYRLLREILAAAPDAAGSPRLHQVDFSGATFYPTVEFDSVKFSLVSFDKATFLKRASFGYATFGIDASFEGADFCGEAIFGGVTFSDDASFDKAIFRRESLFMDARFGPRASFNAARFRDGTSFQDAKFDQYASFRDAKFTYSAQFDGASFANYANFDRASFGFNVSFIGATFATGATLGPLRVGEELHLNDVELHHGHVVAAANTVRAGGMRLRGTCQLRTQGKH